jgi:uncharacterized protein
MKKLDAIAIILLVVGGLNWGLVGFFHFDLVAAIFGLSFGKTSLLSSLVYMLVGLAAIFETVSLTAFRSTPDRQHVPARAR